MNTLIRSNPLCIVAASLFMLLALTPPHTARAQGDCADCDIGSNSAPTNIGTNFLLCFEQNYYTASYENIDDGGYLEIFVATLDYPATIIISCKHYPSLNKVFTLSAHSWDTIKITQDTAYQDLWIESDEIVDDRAVRVTSTQPIVCSGMNYTNQTADATMAQPESSSATDYRIMSYQNSTNYTVPGEFTPSQFAVASFGDNDTVTITPNAVTMGGHAAGVPFSIVLQSGECVQVQTDPTIIGLDLTGSMVSSTSQIAVYGGHARTEMPAGYTSVVQTNQGPLYNTSRDMIWEAMPPTSAWGQSFVLGSIDTDDGGGARAAGDNMRVLAKDNNTIVTVNGQGWVTLNANQFADSLIKGPTLVQSSAPLLVGEYAHSATNNSSLGDPFLAIVPPVDQTNNNYTFLAYPDNLFQYNAVIIATDTNSQSNISYDGALIPASFYTPVPGSVN